MNITAILIGVLAGLAWGALWGWVNTLILNKAMQKKDTNAIMAGNLGRLLVDALALSAVSQSPRPRCSGSLPPRSEP